MEGYVWVSRRESQRLADHLEITFEEFTRRYVRVVRGRHALTDRSDGACVFWDEGCTVYPARPDQCRTFPFWRENVAHSDSWVETAKQCEGVGAGRLYSLGEIRRLTDGDGETAAGDPAPGGEVPH
jgi:Fe-S-cluster containining protein